MSSRTTYASIDLFDLAKIKMHQISDEIRSKQLEKMKKSSETSKIWFPSVKLYRQIIELTKIIISTELLDISKKYFSLN